MTALGSISNACSVLIAADITRFVWVALRDDGFNLWWSGEYRHTLTAEAPIQFSFLRYRLCDKLCPSLFLLLIITACGQCARGYYCPSYTVPQPDAPSYTIWPGAPHTSAAELECGDVECYCPAGSVYPLLVGGGNYSIGGSSNNRTRYAQVPCPPGSFCNRAIPYLCPAGFYGSTYGLLDSSCTGAYARVNVFAAHTCFSYLNRCGLNTLRIL